MLLDRRSANGVDVLAVSGPVARAEARSLLDVVARSLDARPRGVVVDLGQARLEPGVPDVLLGLGDLPSGWPRSALLVCPACEGLPPALQARDTDEAVARVEDRTHRLAARVELPPDLRAPAAARAAVRACADRLALGDALEDVQLVVSELVTNAVRHGRPPVALELETDGAAVVVAVCDGSPAPPQAREADEAAEGGRGMLLVDLLADGHGVRAQPPGKTVWARVPRREGGPS